MVELMKLAMYRYLECSGRVSRYKWVGACGINVTLVRATTCSPGVLPHFEQPAVERPRDPTAEVVTPQRH